MLPQVHKKNPSYPLVAASSSPIFLRSRPFAVTNGRRPSNSINWVANQWTASATSRRLRATGLATHLRQKEALEKVCRFAALPNDFALYWQRPLVTRWPKRGMMISNSCQTPTIGIQSNREPPPPPSGNSQRSKRKGRTMSNVSDYRKSYCVARQIICL